MKLSTSLSALATAALLASGCAAHVPSGPSVMVLPGSNKTFDQFQYDDVTCRRWAMRQTGNPAHAANDTTASDAAIGTVLGAAAGAAVGAASGDPATGAAVGAGLGLLGGTAVGAEEGQQAGWEVQQRYDYAYMQCMYSYGHQVPMPRGTQLPQRPSSGGERIPPPPRGAPPPPPPDAWNAR